MIRAFLRSFWPRYYLCRYRWYRRWYGGRWEFHYIEICHSAMWLEMDRNRCWPDYKQPCSRGTPIIEDYPWPSP